jgi:adenine-specific DNA-methyltransferase
VLYDFPTLTYNKTLKKTTVGRYRDNRLISDFGIKSKAKDAFNKLIDRCFSNRAPLALSYASTSLVEKDFFVSKAISIGADIDIVEIPLMHSGQGQSRNKEVVEYIFFFSYD